MLRVQMDSGGTIRVESEPGIGSSFIITLSDAESRAQT